MIHSMTGFGKAEVKTATKKITVEVRSVNSKQADLSLRCPSEIRHVEMSARKLVTSKLQRGKIDLFITYEQLHTEPSICLNHELAGKYWAMLQSFSQATSIPLPSDPMRTIMTMPGVMENDRKECEEDEQALEEISLKAVEEACDKLSEFRLQEGQALYNGFVKNIQEISTLLDNVALYEEERILEIRQRIEEGLGKYLDVDYDRSRLEQEMIYYIEKLDVNEEKNRLRNHLKYFLETLDQEEVGQGRKLGFISQEMGREINTLGSKSNHAALQRIVVKMKDELEQIKEQVLNVL
ncbi:MAG: YicC family protein [Bacteroidales bacterium]|uniref:YicC/YloC family endoribonuclease n=1 Tax=Porphyromonas sp. TaxID=1924944 RepID=UPI00297B8C62|nr:YicC/YloC family endoribonuclease [Porphyromonas sp.]MDD7437269.1 YicC family protein [Bacteroidales bacterium]MDY3068032.1 YicC/YloC family endoribonuclease [Porphyromonas sp.]